jgi:hypothetical protein
MTEVEIHLLRLVDSITKDEEKDQAGGKDTAKLARSLAS